MPSMIAKLVYYGISGSLVSIPAIILTLLSISGEWGGGGGGGKQVQA